MEKKVTYDMWIGNNGKDLFEKVKETVYGFHKGLGYIYITTETTTVNGSFFQTFRYYSKVKETEYKKLVFKWF